MGQLSTFDSRDVVGTFRKAYEDARDISWASAIAQRVDTDKETETYKWLGAAPALREWQGNRLFQTVGRYTMSITNVKYEASLRFDVDDIRRTVKSGNQIPIVVAEMGAKAASHPESLLSTLINDGDTTTSGLAYDGQQFFDTDHSEGDSGTQKNDLTASEIPAADVVTATAPTPAEMAAIILQAIGYMYTLKDDKGDPINGSARKFGVMVGTSALFGSLATAIGSNRLSAGVDNPLGGLRESGISITPWLNPRRSADTTTVNLFRLDGIAKPFIHQVESPLSTQIVGPGSQMEFTEDAWAMGVRVVEGAGYANWAAAQEITLS